MSPSILGYYNIFVPDFVSSPPSASPSLPVLGYRHVFALLGFLGFLFVYALRICVSVTVVLMAVEFGWSDGDRGLVLSSFFWGYVVLQIPGGTASEKAGGKWIYGGGIFGTCVFTLLTPVSAKYGFGALIFVRALTGLCEGVTFPSMHAMLSRWAPPAERTSLGGIIYCGASMGTVIAMPLTGEARTIFCAELIAVLSSATTTKIFSHAVRRVRLGVRVLPVRRGRVRLVRSLGHLRLQLAGREQVHGGEGEGRHSQSPRRTRYNQGTPNYTR